MGSYKAAVVTEGGQNLIAQALANEKTLIFTSAKTSSYAYPSGTNITALTGLQDIVQSVQPFKSQVLNNNLAQVSVRFDNDGITQQYQIQTIGLYAQIEDGEETLFSVTQAITPDEMPVQSSVSPSAFIYNIQSTVQNASQITVTVNPAGTATVQDIMDIEYPDFEDSGEVEGIAGFPDFLAKVKSKMNIFGFFRDFAAGMKFVLHAGQIVNNCMSDAENLPLAAKQGKVLMDLYTQLNGNLGRIKILASMPTETGNGWYFFETNESVGTIPAWSFGVYIYNSNDGAIFGITADNSLFSAFKIKGNWAPINSIELFKPASGSIKYGMNGIYIGKFENGALIPTETNVFENCIYLIGNGGDQTAVYAFTIGQYSSGHLFFNRMTYDNIWQLDEWKKLI